MLKGGFFCWLKFFIILAAVGAGFFCSENVWASQGIIINEIMTSAEGNTNYEFIELYNNGVQSTDLSNFSIKKRSSTGSISLLVSSARFNGKIILPSGYLLIAKESGYNGPVLPDIVWPPSSSYILANTNNAVILYNGSEIIDEISYQSVEIGKSYERKDDGSWQMSQNTGGTPGAVNSTILTPLNPPLSGGTENPSPQPSPSQGEGDSTASSTEQEITPLSPSLSGEKNKFGDVVINELVSDPADNDTEWIELYNISGREIDLSGWRLEDGSKAKTSLNGVMAVAGFKVTEKPAGNLNNGGDLIALMDATGKIIDQVAYGNWPDGDLTNNAPAAPDPASLARLFDGYNSFNNLNDFAVTIKPTKGASNVILAETEVSQEAKAKYDFSDQIFIAEILPNPAGDDAKGEFIELHNASGREVNLAGWSLSNEDNKKVYLEKIATSSIIKAGEYLAIFRSKSKLVLHNDQGEVKLYEPSAEKAKQAVAYQGVEEGSSYVMENPSSPLYQGGASEWSWSEAPTPGAANLVKTANQPPVVAFSLPAEILVGQPLKFDASDTMDDDGDELKFVWDFGDGFKNNLISPEHTYLELGVYQVKLAVSDGQATTTAEKMVKAVSELTRQNPPSPLYQGGATIVINEIYPNPAGADTGQEWLEIVNRGEGKINLINWRLENGNGQFKFKNDLWLNAGEFYLLTNAESKLALKNFSDKISLFKASGELVETISYAEALESESYARGANGKWFWTSELTPAEENVIKVAARESINNYELAITGDKKNYIETALEQVREIEIGSLVKVKGIVAVLPGILGAQIFYIVGSPGLQIYNYKKDFPVLKVGDYVAVSGELSQVQGELRLKTKTKTDIEIAEHKEPPQALNFSCDQINEENLGQLIKVSGEITDKKSSTIYLDDGSDEILVYLKQAAGIETKNLSLGQKVEITGILSRTASGLRLLPRSQADVKLVEDSGDLKPQILGEVADSDEWELAKRDKKMELFKYLLILAAAGIIGLAVLLFRARKRL